MGMTYEYDGRLRSQITKDFGSSRRVRRHRLIIDYHDLLKVFMNNGLLTRAVSPTGFAFSLEFDDFKKANNIGCHIVAHLGTYWIAVDTKEHAMLIKMVYG